MRQTLKRFLIAGALMVPLIALNALVIKANQVTYVGPLVNESALAYNKTYVLDLNNTKVDMLSAQAVYSSATVASQTFTDGQVSTSAVTVVTNSALASAAATNSLTVLSTSSLSAATISIAGVTLTNGVQWYTQASSAATATSIKTAINTYVPQLVANVTTPTNVVNISAISSGTWGNGMTLSTSVSSITAGGASFSGGRDGATFALNNVSLIASRDFTVGASSAATANSLAGAINASTSLSAIVTSTAPLVCGLTNPCGVVKITSLAVGTVSNYALFVSSYPALTIAGPVTIDSLGRATGAMTGGANASWTINSPSITIANNPFWPRNPSQTAMVGLPVLYSTGTLAIGALTNQTTYYVIPVDANTIKLASSSSNAQAGTAITLTSSATPTTAHTYTLAPLTITGTPSFKWQGSNDSSNWNDVAVSSVTFASPYTAAASLWDFGTVNYRYIRVNAIAPTTGGMALTVTVNGKAQQ